MGVSTLSLALLLPFGIQWIQRQCYARWNPIKVDSFYYIVSGIFGYGLSLYLILSFIYEYGFTEIWDQLIHYHKWNTLPFFLELLWSHLRKGGIPAFYWWIDFQQFHSMLFVYDYGLKWTCLLLGTGVAFCVINYYDLFFLYTSWEYMLFVWFRYIMPARLLLGIIIMSIIINPIKLLIGYIYDFLHPEQKEKAKDQNSEPKLIGPIDPDRYILNTPLKQKITLTLLIVQLYFWLPPTLQYQLEHHHFFFNEFMPTQDNYMTNYIIGNVYVIYFQILWLIMKQKENNIHLTKTYFWFIPCWLILSFVCFCNVSIGFLSLLFFLYH
jgi:hypothetical protein